MNLEGPTGILDSTPPGGDAWDALPRSVLARQPDSPRGGISRTSHPCVRDLLDAGSQGEPVLSIERSACLKFILLGIVSSPLCVAYVFGLGVLLISHGCPEQSLSLGDLHPGSSPGLRANPQRRRLDLCHISGRGWETSRQRRRRRKRRTRAHMLADLCDPWP